MALADENGLRWVAKAQGSRFGLRYDPDMGSPLILHATASGRAWLATLSSDDVRLIMNQRGFGVPDRFGRQKIKTIAELEGELERTRSRGYGLTVEEVESGTAAVAMAIQIGPGKRSPGTISVLGPIIRMSPLDVEEINRKLESAAQEIGDLWPIIEVYQSNVVS
jgi:DNA-binding IclR family transcriptional regulator